MAVACASRFAVLKLDDDDIVTGKQKVSSKKQNAGKSKEDVKNDKANNKTKTKKQKVNSEETEQLHNIVFGTGIKKSKKKTGGPQPSKKQWEEWQKKDTEFVSDAYEQDLQEALLLSKIDFEEKKDLYKTSEKETEQNKLSKKKKKSSQKKEKGIMSLNEFQSFGSGSHKGNGELDDFEIPSNPVPLDESNFFHKIEEESGKIIYQEQRRDVTKAVKPLESARALQFQEELREKDEEIKELNESLAKLKEEIKNVKTRNKKLYNILESGEMREKAEILVQIEDLLSVKDELTEQLNEYHIALEQERSKVHSLQTELKKCQNIKKNRTESK